MLRTTLIGHLGADAKTTQTQRGAPMVTFRVAVNQVRTDADGERQERTEWLRVRVMGRQTESAQHLTKGTRVLVVGRLDISHYETRDGEPRVGFDVWADEVQNLTPRPSGESDEGGRSRVTGSSERLPVAGSTQTADDQLDDLRSKAGSVGWTRRVRGWRKARVRCTTSTRCGVHGGLRASRRYGRGVARVRQGEQVISRLNRTLGFEGWSFRVLEHGIQAEADEVWVLGELRVLAGESQDPIVRQQFGS
jgi:single-strand DNA-binding protein